MTEIGKGSKAGTELSGIISEIELVRDRKKQISDQEKEILASAKANGYDTKTIKRILALRTQDLQKLQESEALFDSYMYAIGMAEELPLFRSIESMGVDVTVAEQVVEALSLLVPQAGEILVKVGAARLRLYRDKEGEPHVEEATEAPPLAPKRSHDRRYADGQGPLDEKVYAGPSPRSRHGLYKEAIAAAVARAEARAAERAEP